MKAPLLSSEESKSRVDTKTFCSVKPTCSCALKLRQMSNIRAEETYLSEQTPEW